MERLIVYHYITEDHGEGTLFVDQNGKVIANVDGNDGNWRGEYFNGVMKHYGIEVHEESRDDDDEFFMAILRRHMGF